MNLKLIATTVSPALRVVQVIKRSAHIASIFLWGVERKVLPEKSGQAIPATNTLRSLKTGMGRGLPVNALRRTDSRFFQESRAKTLCLRMDWPRAH